jgi:hypothetical protein
MDRTPLLARRWKSIIELERVLQNRFTKSVSPWNLRIEEFLSWPKSRMKCIIAKRFDQIIVELKALRGLSAFEEAQILNYLKVSKKQLGLLINFGARPKLEWKRYALTIGS